MTIQAARNSRLEDWEKFKKKHSPLFNRIIGRDQAMLPDFYVPGARGVAVAAEALLRRTCYGMGINRPVGWVGSNGGDVFTKDVSIFGGARDLVVRQIDKTGLWTVERMAESRRKQKSDEVLAYHFGPTPVVTNSPEASMYLAEYCHESQRPPAFDWIKVDA